MHVQADAGDVRAQKTSLLSVTTKAYGHKAQLLLCQGSPLFRRARVFLWPTEVAVRGSASATSR